MLENSWIKKCTYYGFVCKSDFFYWILVRLNKATNNNLIRLLSSNSSLSFVAFIKTLVKKKTIFIPLLTYYLWSVLIYSINIIFNRYFSICFIRNESVPCTWNCSCWVSITQRLHVFFFIFDQYWLATWSKLDQVTS